MEGANHRKVSVVFDEGEERCPLVSARVAGSREEGGTLGFLMRGNGFLGYVSALHRSMDVDLVMGNV